MRLEEALARDGAAFAEYLRASAAALRAGQGPPPLKTVKSALEAYAAEVAALRRDGVTRNLTEPDAAERFYALGFALEQMHNNFTDLGRVVAGWAEPVKDTGRPEHRAA